LALLHDAEQELRSHADDEPRGTLRLALPSTFARMWITPALPELLGAHPGLRIECALSNRYVDLVREGFDAAVRIGELTHASLVARRLAARERVFCAAPSYLAQRGTPRHPDELRAHDTLLFTGAAGYPAWRLINRRGDKLSLRLQGRYVSDDAEALRDAALAGQGIVMAADWLVGRELLEGRLVRILPSWTTIDRAAIYSVVPSRLVARKTRVFLDWITKRLAEPPWLAR
jgi:DNA-binding transcriptional LysR family regulator